MFYNFEKVNCREEYKRDEMGGVNLSSLQNELIENKMQIHERELAHAWSIFSLKVGGLARELDERKSFENNKKATSEKPLYIF